MVRDALGFSVPFLLYHDEIQIAPGLERFLAKLVLNGYQEHADNNPPRALRLTEPPAPALPPSLLLFVIPR
jgi:hypothetical protein